jgi:hypothetical protein
MILFPNWTEVNEDIKKAPPIEGGLLRFTLLRRKPWTLRPWMNVRGGNPSKLVTSVVGYASEGSAL